MKNSAGGGTSVIGSDSSQSSGSLASESSTSFQVKVRTEFLSFLYTAQNSSRKYGTRTFLLTLSLYILLFWSFIWMPLMSPQHFNFGVWGSWIFTVLNYTSSLSMDLLPYDGAIALASISAFLILFAMVSFALTIRVIKTTSKFIPNVKQVFHVSLFITLFLSAPMTYIFTSFVDCDYGHNTPNLVQQQGGSSVVVSTLVHSNVTTSGTYSLNRFENVGCFETRNIIMMIISLISIVVLQLEAILTILVLPNSHPLSNTPMIGDCIILQLLGVVCNILGMLVHFLIPANYAFIRSIVHLLCSCLMIVLLFKRFPMTRRFENSIVAGVISARIGASIGGLVTSLANPLNENVLGIGLSMMTLGMVVILGILGGLIAEFYSRVVVKQIRKKLLSAIQDKNIEREAHAIYQQLEDDGNLNKMDMYIRFTMGVEQMLKGEEENADLLFIISFIRAISSQKGFNDQKVLNSSSCVAAYFMGDEINASTFALALIKKAMKQRPNLYMRFILGQRLKEIETSATEGVRGQKNAIDLKSTFAKIEKYMLEITALHRHFWKEQMQEIINYDKIENIASRNAVLIEECDNMFESLLSLFYNDKTVLRMHAIYLENIKFNRELASEYYNEAMALEDEEGNFQKRGAVFKAKITRKNRVHPDSSSASTVENAENSKKLIPSSLNSINLNMDHPQPVSQTNHETMSYNESFDNFNGIENNVSGEQKKEMAFRNALSIPASRNIQIGIFLLFAGLGFAFLIAGMVIAFEFSDIVTLNVINVIDACSPIAAMTNMLVTIRAYQSTVNYVNITSSTIPKTMTSEMFLSPSLLKQNIGQLRQILVNLQQKAYDAKFNPAVYSHYHEYFYPLYLPIMHKNPGLDTKFYNETLMDNVTITDITHLLVKISDRITAESDDKLMESMKDYGFMLMYRNQETITYAYQKFCRVFTDTAKDDAIRINNIFTIFTSIVLGVYVGYAIIYLIYSRFELSTMKNQIKLIHSNVSKNEVGKLYHDLGKKVGDEVSIHISSSSIFKPKNIFIVIGVLVMVVVSLSLGIFLNETLGNSKYSFESYITMEDGFDAMFYLQRLSFSVAELYQYYSTEVLNNFGLGELQILSASETRSLRDKFEYVVFNLRYYWNLCMYGSAVKAFETLVVGMFPETDQLIRGDLNCSFEGVYNKYNTEVIGMGYKPENFTHCDLGIDYMVQYTILKASRIIEDLVATTKTTNHQNLLGILQEFYSVAFLSNAVSFELIDFSLIFAVKSSTPMVNQIYTLAVIGFIVNLIGCIVMYYFLRIHWKNVFSLRSLFNYISIETFESNEKLKNYALYHALSDGALSRLFMKKRNVSGEDAKVRNILNAAVDGVVLCNSSSCIDIFNPAAQRMFGNQQEDVIGKLLLTLLCPQHHDEIRKAVDSMKQTVTEFDPKGETFDVECIRKNQTTFPAKVNIFVTLFEKKPIITCFIKDITSEKKHNALLSEEKKNSEVLLLNILPGAVAAKLKNGTSLIAEKFADITCFFSDMVGFTSLSSKLAPNELVQMLNQIVMGFDDLTDRYNLEKIKTIGDAYFCAGGLHDLNAQSDHPERVLKFAIDTFGVIRSFNSNFRRGRFDEQINIRIGLNTGPVVAGVIGKKKFAYDLWGDSINTASRMESNSKPGRIQVSRTTYERVYDLGYSFEERMIEIKGKGMTQTYLLSGKHHESAVLTFEELNTATDNFVGEDISSEKDEQQEPTN